MTTSKGKQLWSKGALAASTVVAAGAGMSGLASAQAVISTTGPGSYNSITENGNGGGWYGQDMSWASNWSSWNPYTWQKQGKSFDDWYNSCKHMLYSHAPHYSSWYNMGGYGGDDWDSWNPYNFQWRMSYASWYYGMMHYMNNHYNQWQNNWGGYGGGSDYSSNDHKNYTHESSYSNNNNQNHDYAQLASYDNSGGYGGGNDNYTNDHHDNYGSNHQSFSSTRTTTVRNTNDISVTNNNPQTATSGDVGVSRNTRVGSVTSGEATNSSQANFDVNVTNDNSGVGGSGGSTWSPSSNYNTGPHSRNNLTVNNRQTTNVTNTNDVTVTNNNRQTATSGDVTASHNTHVGSVSSGDASNYSSAEFNVDVQNNN